jgi:hypothetical protein
VGEQLLLGGAVTATERPRRLPNGAPDVWFHEVHAERVRTMLTRACPCGAGLGERCQPDVSYRVLPPYAGAGVWFAFHSARVFAKTPEGRAA